MEELREELKKALIELGPRGRGKVYPKGLLEKVLSYTVARRRQGARLIDVGEELGIGFKTLSRWLRGKSKPRRFERVEVVAAPARALTVHGPRGLRIEGLDIDGVAELVQRLGG
jgi:transcriptional regulator with XRE-family HTH domain